MRARRPLPDKEYLWEHYHYDPETGTLTHAIYHNGNAKVGQQVNCDVVYLDRKKYQRGRFVWKMMTGEDPTNLIDHKDGNHQNYCWSNLRPATYTQNAMNRAHRKDLCTTGHRGVRLNTKHPGGKRYKVVISVSGSVRELGTYDTLEQAIAVRQAAELKHFGEYRTDRVI